MRSCGDKPSEISTPRIEKVTRRSPPVALRDLRASAVDRHPWRREDFGDWNAGETTTTEALRARKKRSFERTSDRARTSSKNCLSPCPQCLSAEARLSSLW